MSQLEIPNRAINNLSMRCGPTIQNSPLNDIFLFLTKLK